MTQQLKRAGYAVGETRVRRLLKALDHTCKVGKVRMTTTDSRHTLLHYPNRIKYLEITHVNQVWVADITYLETEQGFCYLSLITDACSRRIVGYDLSLSLSVEGALRSLKMTIEQAVSPLAGLIHHSDHGVQYTSHAYRDCLANNGIYSSMGAVGNCYENALAERMNGILKLEYGLDGCFVDLDQARQAVREAVWLYSFERPHLALAYQVPAQFHAAQLLADQHLAI